MASHNKLIEDEIKQAYVGKICNERYSELFNKVGTFFPLHCDRHIKWKFNITPALYLGWEQRSIDFRINVVCNDGTITYCGIGKRKDNYNGLYTRNQSTDLKPTQQELILFKRVMEYITTLEE